MVLRSPSHPDRKGGKPESLSPEPLFSKTGMQGDTLPPSSGTQWPDLVPAGWRAQGCWLEGLLPREAPPCPSSACYLASAPQGPGWDLPQVLGGRVGEQRQGPGAEVRAVSGGSSCCVQDLLSPRTFAASPASLPGSAVRYTTTPVRFLLQEPPSPPLGTKPEQTRHVAHSPRPGYGGPGLCQLSPRQAALVLAGSWTTLQKAPSALSKESKE